MLSGFRKYLLTLPLFFCLPSFTAENDSVAEQSIAAKFHYGFVIPHHSFIEYLIKDHLYAFELNYSLTGHGYWDSIYYKPERGFGFMYSGLGNQDVLGNSFSFFGYCNYHLFHSSNDRFRADFRVGTGLGYVTKIFSVYGNNENLVLSSHLNAQINLGLEFKYRLSSGSIISMGGRLSHLSNGKMSSPNYGINLFTINTGFSYYLGKRPSARKVPLRPSVKTWMYEGLVSGGMTNISAQIPEKFMIASAIISVYRQYNIKYRWGFGADLFYNESNYANLTNKNVYYWEPQQYSDKSDNFSAGIHLAQEFCHSKFTYLVHMGTYLHSALYGLGGLYHRIGLKYSLHNNIFLNVSVKTHWAVAEYVEWGIGYKIH